MPLFGKAAVAMWWTIDPAMRREFGDWHSHEHFPERMGIAGFRRGSRWVGLADPGQFFVLYELADYEVLTSTGYRDRLDNPTPWSTTMMPHHLGMTRSQARIVASCGGGIGNCLATIRLSPQPGATQALGQSLQDVLGGLAMQPGLTGGHLLVTETPAAAGQTTEQQIRGKDAVADWVVIVTGYDRDQVTQVLETDLGPAALARMGAQDGALFATHTLSYCMTPNDLQLDGVAGGVSSAGAASPSGVL